MVVFVYNRSREISGNAQDTFIFTVEKNKLRNNLFTSMEEMIDSFFVKQSIQGKQHETVQ